ncbi:biopolymer transporter ExbD [Carboxylicivirga sp. A043]|uniref:ExbD/TolR family protein n=1 Tax=Carboxylicivirga litoralis TaxID=2816963 RepID=UPI0021CB97C5|nr:biopolymer transporter ExbD [Carboxylicivirga sp. A043]MCU4157734.1 biopolymer transporter ExbD [Carboxylicivirga sp. A043]
MTRRQIKELNAGSMADIAFLLLIFFLVTTTMDSDLGLGTVLPPYIEDIDAPPKNDRNVFEILVNSDNQLLVEKRPMKLNFLTEATKEFILNPSNKVNLSAKEMKDISLLGIMEVSKGIISLQTANDTEYQTYLMVQNEIVRAFNEMRNEMALRKFGNAFSDLTSQERAAIREACPKLISEAEPVKISSR